LYLLFQSVQTPLRPTDGLAKLAIFWQWQASKPPSSSIGAEFAHFVYILQSCFINKHEEKIEMQDVRTKLSKAQSASTAPTREFHASELATGHFEHF
jgi:hypothetical protein